MTERSSGRKENGKAFREALTSLAATRPPMLASISECLARCSALSYGPYMDHRSDASEGGASA